MPEQEELGSRLNEYIEGLKKQAEGLRTGAEDYDLQAEYLMKQRELFERYGAKVPIAMQTIQFMIEQIAASHAGSSTSSEDPPKTSIDDDRINIPRPRRRHATPRGRRAGQGRNYNIASKVKPIMNGIFGRDKIDVPEYLDSLFNRMYGQNWHSRTIDIPLKPGLKPVTRTYLEDLHSGDSYIRRLIEGADEVINRNMRNNTPPAFPFRGRVAAVELAQLYHKIDTIGWDVYDGFMVRNGIRQPKTS